LVCVQLSQRLELIRYVHGLSRGVSLSVSSLRSLWGLLDSPRERELFLAFLEDGAANWGGKHENLHPAFYEEEHRFVFHELICKDVDWTGLGTSAYSCFNAFFRRFWPQAVQSHPGPGGGSGGGRGEEEVEDLTELSMDTLWRVTLTVQNTEVAASATRDLLDVSAASCGP
ncbi:unnamed protein product, partial [Discosporangium mesarthrocarpum]